MGHTNQIKVAVILLILHITVTKTDKNSAPSVHEVINEQARIDDKRPLPYTNPLAGNSLQNAKLHAQHQQAMFNAERVRQHRAQIQRWNKAPQQVDSYMRAYHESQENHQLALEKMQATPKQENKRAKSRPERLNLKTKPQLEPVKLTRADAVDKNRNHRSFGSVYHVIPEKGKINTYPGTTYDQGVTIKPNGNIGLNNLETEYASLYTDVIPSKTQYIYPKLYSQMHSYQSADDIKALNSLLVKSPQEQITELDTLIHTNKKPFKDTLEKPIDLFFYLNNPNGVPDKQKDYTGPYATEYVNYQDHKPITEEIDELEDNSKPIEIKTYFQPQQPSPTALPQIHDQTSTKISNHKLEVNHQLSGHKPKHSEFSSEHKPSHSALNYEKPLTYYAPASSTEGVKYLQSQHSGIQHLSHDGTGVSAFGDDDIHYAANYEFGYRVRDHETGNDFGHQEHKSGDETRGHYHVLLPDGRLQQVRYSAGPNGFHADISYDH